MNIVNILTCSDFLAEDLSVAKEFLGPRNSPLKNLSLAHITIPPGVSVEKHYHLESEETYHIIDGSGIMNLEGEVAPISKDQAVAITLGQWHSIYNPNDTDLVMCVTCSPPWRMEDQIFE